jgi:methylated-DNA-[protein]-cysteine S-methyltransferase
VDTQTIVTPIGNITIISKNDALLRMELKTNHPITKKPNPIAQSVQRYFKHPMTPFTIKISPSGTDYQKKVWQALQKIPVGTVLTYGELAKKLHSSPRAIGQACKRNPVPIVIPCHRIVSQHDLGGFFGKTRGNLVTVKAWLLQHEGLSSQHIHRIRRNKELS